MNHIYKTSNKHLRKAMFSVFGGKCFYSGRPVAENDFEIDHVVPKSKGGENSVYNYVLVAKNINRKKHNKYDAEAATKILYIVRITYAPKVLELLNKKEQKDKCDAIQYFIDKGFDRNEAIEMKKFYIDEGEHTVGEAWMWAKYGSLLGTLLGEIGQTEDIEMLNLLQKEFEDIAAEIKDKIKTNPNH